MWIKCRSMDGTKSVTINDLSKLTKIGDLRVKLEEPFDAKSELIKLFFRGKQLVDGHTIFDYKIGLNEIVQVVVSKPVKPLEKVDCDREDNINKKENETLATIDNEKIPAIYSPLYEIDEEIELFDSFNGAWFEGKIIDIKKFENEKGCFIPKYKVKFDIDNDVDIFAESDIRPLAHRLCSIDHVKPSDKVMVNFNVEHPLQRGYWYDSRVTKCTDNEIIVTLLLRSKEIENCKIVFKDEIFKIENPKSPKLENNSMNKESNEEADDTEKEKCRYCHDNSNTNCKLCQCCRCGDRREPEKQILCDECNRAFHIDCLVPPLSELPTGDEWFCAYCKNDENEVIKPGEKLRKSAKKSDKKPRDWGKGMACVGRTSSNTMVPSNHKGTIPGIEVGMSWRFRVQVSESGCHRPPVAGIHGREKDVAYSLVLSGGYEDDVDDGDSFTYTGSGGRDLSGNKRTAAQASDQLLNRMNLALARCCSAKVDQKGASAEVGDAWKSGSPVRVVRNEKGRKHSSYAPEEGNRYDGIYKVKRYWQAEGLSGFKVWRFLLQRDDPVPAPWTEQGRLRIEKLGLVMKYPEGYLENTKNEENVNKRKASDGNNNKDEESSNASLDQEQPSCKKVKFDIEEGFKDLVGKDFVNSKIWADILLVKHANYSEFLSKVEEKFSCICCQEIVFEPVTLKCSHSICKTCLNRSFKAKVYNCPACRFDLKENFEMAVNENLGTLLADLFPNYHDGR